MKTRSTTLGATVVALAACGLGSTASGQSYEFSWQESYGYPATFRVTGPATGEDPDVEGDAILQEVEMANGDLFQFFYKPVAVSHLRFGGERSYFRVRGGVRTTGGVQGDTLFPDAEQGEDWRDHEWDEDDRPAVAAFEARALAAFTNNNLNNYVDLGSSGVRFSLVIKFNLVVNDNDSGPDDFGELLYFERGAGDGNSWVKMRAVDENGSPRGPWLVIGPTETVQTTPQTSVMRIDQKMGTTAVDVSRLGVTEVQYIELSNDVLDEPAYTGGGDLNPDFKLMAVMTDEAQIEQVLGLFD